MKCIILTLLSLIPACLANMEPPKLLGRHPSNQDDMKSQGTSIKNAPVDLSHYRKLQTTCQPCDSLSPDEAQAIDGAQQREGAIKELFSRAGSGGFIASMKQRIGNLRKPRLEEASLKEAVSVLEQGLDSAIGDLNTMLYNINSAKQGNFSMDTADLVMTVFDIQENIIRRTEDLFLGLVNVIRNVGVDSMDIVVSAVLGTLAVIEEVVLVPIDAVSTIAGQESSLETNQELESPWNEYVDSTETTADLIGPTVWVLIFIGQVLVKVIETTPKDVAYFTFCLLGLPECPDDVEQDQLVKEAAVAEKLDDEDVLLDVTCQLDLVTCELNELKAMLEEAGYYSEP